MPPSFSDFGCFPTAHFLTFPEWFPQLSPKSYRYNSVPNRFSSHFSASRTNGPRSLSRVKAGTHSALGERSHTAAHTAKQGPSGRGRYHYPRHVLHVHEHPRAGCQNGVLCRFGILPGRCSRRTQRAFGTAMRLCASLSRRRRSPAGLRDLFRFCRNCGLYALRSGPFRVCEARGGITLEMSRNVQSGNTQNLKSSAAPVRLPAAPASTPGTSQAAAQAGCVYRP